MRNDVFDIDHEYDRLQKGISSTHTMARLTNVMSCSLECMWMAFFTSLAQPAQLSSLNTSLELMENAFEFSHWIFALHCRRPLDNWRFQAADRIVRVLEHTPHWYVKEVLQRKQERRKKNVECKNKDIFILFIRKVRYFVGNRSVCLRVCKHTAELVGSIQSSTDAENSNSLVVLSLSLALARLTAMLFFVYC